MTKEELLNRINELERYLDALESMLQGLGVISLEYYRSTADLALRELGELEFLLENSDPYMEC